MIPQVTQVVDASGSPRRRLLLARDAQALDRALDRPALALLASLVVGPAAPAAPERTIRRDRRLHPRPGASQPQGRLDRQQPPRDRPRHQQHLVRRPDLRQRCDASSRGSSRASRSSSRRARRPSRSSTRPSAVWSDGKPVTCEDWKATWRVFVNPQFNVVSRDGLRGHQVGHLQRQVRDDRLQQAVSRPGSRWCRAASTPRTSSAART